MGSVGSQLKGLTVRDGKGILRRACCPDIGWWIHTLDKLTWDAQVKVLSPEMKEKIKQLSSPSQVSLEDTSCYG